MTMKRRDALKTIGGLVGAAGASQLLPGCVSEPQGPGTIDTFVYLMMENRSYDHYLGSRSLVEGRAGDGLAKILRFPDLDGHQVAMQPADARAMCMLDPPHDWDSARAQLAGGACDGFLRVDQQANGRGAQDAIHYLLREHIPVSHALADAYTSCDRWFSSLLGPTLPNRMYWHAGTSNRATTNDEVLHGAFAGVPTIYHRLDQAGVDWAYYYGDVPVLAAIKDLPLKGRLRRFMWDFIDDAAAGKLPPVTYVDPGFTINDDHPPHHPLLGQQLISAVYTALATSPQWKRCLLVVTYDEHGGFFDHVAPPADAVDANAALGFGQLGFRVPTLVAGPYAKQGFVSSVRRDHASALAHLERAFALAPLTARTGAANDLTDCIDLDRLATGAAAEPIDLPAVELDASTLPASCDGKSFLEHDHDLVKWAAATDLGDLDLRGDVADYAHGIGEFLDRHGRGRIRRDR